MSFKETPDDVSVVLVHGAWADGSSWSRVVAPLAAEGVAVVAAQLPLTSLEEDVTAVGRAIDRVSGPVVLVGHAYGGAVITAVRNDRVRGLVYIAAGTADEGQTIIEAFYGAEPPPLAPDRNGLIHLPRQAFSTAFAPDASRDEQAVLAAVQRPISIACITVPLRRPLWKDVPSWFLVAERDGMIPAATQRRMAERMSAKVHSRDIDHTPLVTAPSAVLDVIREAVRSVKGQ
jgi:pimeloyl-ACP methyl ester carboxylesterase